MTSDKPTAAARVRKRAGSFTPAYRQIEMGLREQIVSGVWAAGAMIPGRRELARQYGVDVNTVQKAVSILLDGGLLRADGWRGTFVADRLVEAPSATHDTPSTFPVHSQLVGRVGVIASVNLELARQAEAQHWNGIVLSGFERAFTKEDGITLCFQNRRSEVRGEPNRTLEQAVELSLEHRIDALVVILPKREEIDSLLSLVDTGRIPTIIVTGDYAIERTVPHILYDNSYAGYEAARHLLMRGYKNLSYYAPFEGSWTRERLDGCREAMTRSGRNASDIVESDCDRSVSPSSIRQSQFAYECAGDFLATPRELWGIVAANDHCAWGLLQAASELGLAAGRDFGLVGFDDLSRSRDLGLTSFQPPLDAMGRQAGDLICKALRGEQIPMQMRLKSHLVPRESTRRLVAPAS